MKHIFMTLALGVLVSVQGLAASFTIDGLTYSAEGENAILTKGVNQTNVVIPSKVTDQGVTYKVTEIGQKAFYGMKDVYYVTLPNTVTSIGVSAFDNCSHLTTINLPESLVSMKGYCFYGTMVQEAIVPEGCKEVGNYNWTSCEHLTSVSLPSTLEVFGAGVFAGTKNLETVNVAEGCQVLSSHEGILYNKDMTILILCPAAKTGNVVIPESCTSFADNAFRACKIGSVTLSGKITKVPDDCFRECRSLKQINLENVTSIGARAFFCNSSMSRIALPETLTNLSGVEIFCGMDALEEIVIPASVTGSMGGSVFSSNQNLKRVVLGANMKNFTSSNHFQGNPALEEIVCNNPKPYTFANSPGFSQANYDNVKVTVPAGSLAAYKSASYWKDFKNLSEKVDQPNSVEVAYTGPARLVRTEDAIIPVKIKNQGNNKVTSIDYTVSIDGNQGEYSLDNISLPAYESMAYGFPATMVPAGKHTIKVNVTKVNGESNASSQPEMSFALELFEKVSLPQNAPQATYTNFKYIIQYGGHANPHIDAAHLFADPSLVGKQVLGMKIIGIASEGISNAKLWFSTHCDMTSAQFMPDGEQVPVTVENGEASAAFSIPAIVPQQGLYFGISLDNDLSGTPYPVTMYGTDEKIEKSFMLHGTSNSYFLDYSKDGVLGVILYLPDDMTVPGKVVLTHATNSTSTIAGNPADLDLTYQNFTGKEITNLDYDCSFGGNTQSVNHSYTEPTSAYLLQPHKLTISLPAIATAGTYVGTVGISKANGVVNPEAGKTADVSYYVGAFMTTHHPIIEEYSGTGCGWCPRGTMGMNEMAKTVPDFIGVAYHGYNSSDPMYVNDIPYKFSGAPSCVIDRRSGILDPFYGTPDEEMGIRTDYDAQRAFYAPADMSLETTFNADSTITAKTNVNFAYIDGGYTVGYVLSIDSLSHPDLEAWTQETYYPTKTWDEPMVKLLINETYDLTTYNHVAIDCNHAAKGKGQSWTVNELELGRDYEAVQTFDLHNCSLADNSWLLDEDLSKINVIALLIDDNGLIRNAAKVRVGQKTETPTGVNQLTQDQDVPAVYYNLMGQRVLNPAAGNIYIRVKGQQATKVIF